MTNNHYKKKKSNQTALEIIIVGIFKMIWWLIRLPFGKKTSNLKISDKQEIISKRFEIENKLKSEHSAELQLALFESDKLVDYVLKIKGYKGETFADRLRSAEKDIPNGIYDRIWQGHKIRNTLAHEHNINLPVSEVRGAINNLLEYVKNV